MTTMSVNEVRIKRVADAEAFVVRGSGYPATNRTFCIGNEDHTIGNALRHVLIQNANVTFAGYSVPHPSEPIVQIRIQTRTNDNNQQQTSLSSTSNNSRVVTAIDALRQSCSTLHDQCDIVMDQLEELLPDVREDRIKMENFVIQNEDYYNEAEFDDEGQAEEDEAVADEMED